MISLDSETREVLRKYGIVANKRLGQNFLVSEEVISTIISKSNLSKEDLVIEIGPGLGNLTKYLLEACGKVVCIELDTKMIGILKERFYGYNNLEIINADILKVNLNEIIGNNREYKRVKIVANLPYYITTPIIMKLLENKYDIDTITIMIQKEVAQRIVAQPGGKDYGVLTLSVKYYADSQIIADVPNTNFIPVPSVDSAVVLLDLYKEKKYEVEDEKILFSIIKGGFSQRRKLFFNAVESYLKFYQVTKEEFVQILNKYHIDELRRAETLSLEQFIGIANDISYIKKSRE